MSEIRYSPSNVLEQAVVELINQGIEMEFLPPVYQGDVDTVKEPMPYIVVLCTKCEEAITPGCGIFDSEVEITYKSHTKLTGSDGRDDTLKQLVDLAYGPTSLPEKLSEKQNFHCHGWVDMGHTAEFSDSDKSVIHKLSWRIVFMPSNNE